MAKKPRRNFSMEEYDDYTTRERKILDSAERRHQQMCIQDALDEAEIEAMVKEAFYSTALNEYVSDLR